MLMKKTLTVLCLVLAGCILLTACGEFSDIKGEVQRMFTALSAGDAQTAAAMLHPAIAVQLEDPQGQLQQIIDLLAGRSVSEIKQTYYYTGFKLTGQFIGKELKGVFDVVLNDGTVCQLQAIYFDGNQKGFASFYLSFPEETNEITDAIES